MEKIKMYVRWKDNEIKCACSISSPLIEKCPYFKYEKCSKEIMMYDHYENIDKCMKHSSFKRVKGSLRQVR